MVGVSTAPEVLTESDGGTSYATSAHRAVRAPSLGDLGPLAIDYPAAKGPLRAAVAAKCRQLGAAPVAIGIVADHAHLLVRLPATLAVSTLIKEVKGSSSHLVTHVVAPGPAFKWQGAYGAFSVWAKDLPGLAAYIRDQERHHAGGELREEWEITGDEATGLARD